MSDIDEFKRKDVFGHAFGDEVLRAVATRLDGMGSPVVAASRLHGDELALLIKGRLVGNPALFACGNGSGASR